MLRNVGRCMLIWGCLWCMLASFCHGIGRSFWLRRRFTLCCRPGNILFFIYWLNRSFRSFVWLTHWDRFLWAQARHLWAFFSRKTRIKGATLLTVQWLYQECWALPTAWCFQCSKVTLYWTQEAVSFCGTVPIFIMSFARKSSGLGNRW